MTKNQFKKLSLSAEELALAFSMTNHPDIGRRLLDSVTPNQTNEQKDAHLTAASHSLGAHGFVKFTQKQVPVLNDALEESLFPMVRFDQVIQLSRASASEQHMRIIYMQQHGTFTAHQVERGVIHILETGETRDLAIYMSQAFSEVGEDDLERSIAPGHKLSLGLLGKIIKSRKSGDDPVKMLVEAGLSKEICIQLGEDMIEQVLRGSLISMDIPGDNPLDVTTGQTKTTLLLLAGKERKWLFEAPTAKDDEIVCVTLINKSAFIQKLETLIGN